MKDKKEIEVLLKVIERLISKNPEIQKFIDKSIMLHVKEEIFFIFDFLCCCFYHNELPKHKLFVCKIKQLMKILWFSFGDDQEKKIMLNFVGVYFLTLEL